MDKDNENVELACTLNDAEFKERRALSRQTVLPQIAKYERIRDGLIIQFRNTTSTISNVKEFIRLEQGCCGFLNFELDQIRAPSNEPINLIVTGPEGATKFIDIFVKLIREETDAKNAA